MSQSNFYPKSSQKSVIGGKLIRKILSLIIKPKSNQEKTITKYLELAKIAEKQGQLEEALGYYQDILGLKPDYAEIYYYRALINIAQKNINDAIANCKLATNFSPASAEIYLDLGNLLIQQSNVQEAIQCYDKVIVLKPDWADAYYYRGNACQVVGQYEQATKDYQKAIALKCSFPDLYLNLGTVLSHSGQVDEAIKAYKKNISQGESPAKIYQHIGKLLEKNGQIDQAIQAYQQTISHGESPAEIYQHIGKLLEENGQFDQAIQAYQQAINNGESPAEIYQHIGKLLEENGQLDQAIQAYQQAINNGESPAKNYQHIGKLLEENGQFNQAIQAYQQAINNGESPAKNYQYIGQLFENNGQIEQAIEAYQEAIKINDNAIDNHQLLGKILEKAEQYELAADSYFKVGQIYRLSGQVNLAIDNYQHSFRLIQQFCQTIPPFMKAALTIVNKSQQVSYDISLMVLKLIQSPVIYHPSKFWTHYMMSNIDQLKELGMENFKRTINLNYFNWISDDVDEQLKTIMEKNLQEVKQSDCLVSEIPQGWTDKLWKNYETFLKYFWEFTKSKDGLNILEKIEEPTLGNPFLINYKSFNISQDICNSVLEINAATHLINKQEINQMRIAELGGGYGRISQVLLQAFSGVKVTLIDIPPALFIAQWYLTNLFPNLRVFNCQNFSNYETIKEEFEQASISFLLPHQIEYLPDNMFNLFINVSSLQEMKLEQIEMWFNHIDRVCSGSFYSKQWYRSQNDFDGIIIDEENYPVKSHWREIYKRTCQVQNKFFEALYKIP